MDFWQMVSAFFCCFEWTSSAFVAPVSTAQARYVVASDIFNSRLSASWAPSSFHLSFYFDNTDNTKKTATKIFGQCLSKSGQSNSLFHK